MSILNDRIKERRLALDMILADVADHLNVKEATAQRYESGDIKNIKHETVVSLAELFKCSPAYLMGWTDEPEIPASTKSKFSQAEIEFLRKFKSLDEKGKHTVKTILEMEYSRVRRTQFDVVAAHNDDQSDEQLKLMQQDIDEL
ncbi:helix-turn-helix domain-containing protein [Paenibacillus sp. GCM10012307]|uniref:Helix-turn-helix domain-containing protein n=1 Tax=Paenibacillus roseus TaxID=2798579 RepID=A0A934MNB0_9BACL|nr:helix-turn-helix domain-containing protein [Paenibacillus roseus]MBJ6360821.1 helix-turn-helix domain-containing protein [Paenibacillus roseus]